jgi:hypothetical protein
LRRANGYPLRKRHERGSGLATRSRNCASKNGAVVSLEATENGSAESKMYPARLLPAAQRRCVVAMVCSLSGGAPSLMPYVVGCRDSHGLGSAELNQRCRLK